MPLIASKFDDFSTGSPLAIVLNTEGLYFLLFDKVFKDIVISSDLIFVDGIGLKIVLNFYGYKSAKRLHGPDFFHEMLHREDGRKRMILGGTQKAHSMLFQKFPELLSSKDRLFCADKVDSQHMNPVFDLIEEFGPDEIFVCLGIRKQELIGSLIKKNFPEICIVGVGASIDFESGNVRRSPLFFQKIGFEWLARLIKEPRMIPRQIRAAYGFIYFLVARLFGSHTRLSFFK